MGATNTKTYEIDGRRYGFDHLTFDRAFRRCAKEKLRNLGQFARDVGGKVHASDKAVNAWRYGDNAPSDLEIIRDLADIVGVELGALLFEKECDDMTRLTEEERQAIIRVYREVSDFLYMLDRTDGCVWKSYKVVPGSPWCKYLTPSPDYGEGQCVVIDGPELADAGYDWVCHALERECAILGGHPVYGELVEFADGPLLEIWDGKTDPDYRFHPHDEPGLTTEIVEKGIREILGKYA